MDQEQQNPMPEGNTPSPEQQQAPAPEQAPTPMMDEQPKKSKTGLIVGVIVIIIIIAAAFFFSTGSNLRGTLDVTEDSAKQEYMEKLQSAKTAAEEKKAEDEYIEKVVKILEN